jgi:purine-binding chemotaxis protein CheW
MTETMPVLTFTLDDQFYALPIDQVVEVASMVELVHPSRAQPEVLGMANRHGEVLPVLDLRLIMGAVAKPVDEWTLFMVAHFRGQLFGLVVDEVQQVDYIPVAHIHQSTTAGLYVRGIISFKQRLIQIIALEPLMAAYVPAGET